MRFAVLFAGLCLLAAGCSAGCDTSSLDQSDLARCQRACAPRPVRTFTDFGIGSSCECETATTPTDAGAR